MRRPDSSTKPIRFAGYAAVFDRVDQGGDIVRKGAFRRSLARNPTIPLLWQHRSGAVIGHIETIREDRRGLRIIGEVSGGETAARAARFIRQRHIDGLSFGYRVHGASHSGGIRELTDIDLLEISVVAQPMQPRARIHAVETD